MAGDGIYGHAVRFPSLALRVQEVLKHDPLGGHLFCFRGKRGDLIKVVWHDGQGACLFTKRLSEGCFAWPTAKDQVAVSLTKAQLSLLLDGIDWRRPSKTYRPRLAG
ncbi:conserved hypothetical protein [Mesorhizobium plurifarium]|uniref:Transposase n=1 Tax=Mesorhizobium plurifarium TaxID=69974 RepID=A0A090G1E5_MESPL|nr:conserved hypothetical protein [Mesorhizobium plurifarium]